MLRVQRIDNKGLTLAFEVAPGLKAMQLTHKVGGRRVGREFLCMTIFWLAQLGVTCMHACMKS
jgi:hypothetical protein